MYHTTGKKDCKVFFLYRVKFIKHIFIKFMVYLSRKKGWVR